MNTGRTRHLRFDRIESSAAISKLRGALAERQDQILLRSTSWRAMMIRCISFVPLADTEQQCISVEALDRIVNVIERNTHPPIHSVTLMPAHTVAPVIASETTAAPSATHNNTPSSSR